MELSEALMPTGFAIRFRPLRLRDERLIEQRVERMKGGDYDRKIETLKQLLIAYTKPLELKRTTEPMLGPAGQPLVDNTGKLLTEVDVDATLAAIPPEAWLPCTYESLSIEGPGCLYEIFKCTADAKAANNLIIIGSASGVNNISALSGKVRTISA